MSDVFVARQPIFDRSLDVTGYELLFRSGDVTNALVTDPERATASVVLNSFTELGLDRIVGDRRAWINVSREFVLRGLAQSLPAELVCLEVLEDQVIDDQLIGALRQLKEDGYRLALDDFRFSQRADELLGLADIVKLDLLALQRDELRREIDRLRPYGVTLLAEKLESREDYAFCAELGCELFQGYFFCRPEVVRGRKIDANRLSLLELLAQLAEPGVELQELERTIALDLGLSYRLLRYINSAFFGLRQEVRSIRQAVALLGTENLKQWASLSVFASVDDKPVELTLTALVRARFCELAARAGAGENPSEMFTFGLFSLVDALLDVPMADVVKRIPFPDETRQALVTQSGPKGQLIVCVVALEQGHFELAEAIVPNAGDHYRAALEWANQAAEALFAASPTPG